MFVQVVGRYIKLYEIMIIFFSTKFLMKNLQKLYILEMGSTLLESQISDISIRLQSLHKDMSKLYLEKKIIPTFSLGIFSAILNLM